jgi:hypothetical protein
MDHLPHVPINHLEVPHIVEVVEEEVAIKCHTKITIVTPTNITKVNKIQIINLRNTTQLKKNLQIT